MLTRLLLSSVLVATPAAQALAQRTSENANRAAQDAFGTSVGNERIGLYSPDNARGFSPMAVGNMRIDGLYFDQQGPNTRRLVSGVNVRVGLTAQGFPFPAPTGIADIGLRKPGGEAALSAFAQYGPFGGASIELDGQIPITERLSVGGGASFAKQELPHGASAQVNEFGMISTWRPTNNIEVTPFWGMIDWNDYEDPPVVYTAGAYLPPKIERRRSKAPEWLGNQAQAYGFGVSSTAAFGPWTIRAGLFRSLVNQHEFYWESYLDTTEDGIADYQVRSEKGRRFASVSGELRASRQFDEGDRRHTFHLNLRGRDKARRYGGGQTVSFGPTPIGEPVEVAKPDFTFGPQSHDQVKQLNVGLGYDLRWLGVGQLSLGMQKVKYRKAADRAGAPLPESRSQPWLPSATLNIEATKKLVLYGSYSKGLEESPIAPAIARNAGFAPPAILSTQIDAGLRYLINPSLRLVVGAFQIEKPHYGLDRDRVFSELGSITHKGLEFSLSGTIAPGLNIVAGTMLLDAKVSGTAVEQGLLGKRPVGSTNRISSGSIDYRIPGTALSIDVGYTGTGKKVANSANSLTVDPENSFSVGGRYRFEVAGKPTVLRAQVQNLTNDYNFWVSGEGLGFTAPRRFLVNLTTDI